MRSILITQCLQRDFVGPLAPWEPLPCTLHIGASESARLMGLDPAEGPLVRFVTWAHDQSPESLCILHIRDRHLADDPQQAGHLAHFGPHCLDGTPGFEFVYALPDARGRTIDIIDSPSLNDFLGTDHAVRLETGMEPDLRFGIIGTWTDAKVSLLAYELRTRYPHADIAVCSALTASSSRERTSVPDEAALRDHGMLMERVVALPDLGGRIPDAVEAGVPESMQRTWETLRMICGILAEFVGTYLHPWQYHLVALRYAAHTLSFEEATLLQKKAALVGTGLLARSCGNHLDESLSLRVDWVPRAGKRPIGLTILPGRKDRLRDLGMDIGELMRQKVTHVATLVTAEGLRKHRSPRAIETAAQEQFVHSFAATAAAPKAADYP
ncbi:MAG: hypothetical protein M3Y08_11350 [Fibrobacterota bacterium]|nr:hypothetical protein [Fibrobacterota bacterium]